MLTPTALAALLAAAPYVIAQGVPDIPDVTSTSTGDCTTRYGATSLSTGPVPTTFVVDIVTNTRSLLFTTRETVTATPNATTITDIATTTSVVTTTTTSTPAATTIPTPAGFLPLLAANPDPTGSSRIKRRNSLQMFSLKKRQDQTLPGNTAGFVENPDGSGTDLNLIYPQRVLCPVHIVVNTTEVTVETAAPTTILAPQSTALVQATSTVIVTTTITEIGPTPSVYAACGPNNVVDHISYGNGNRINFNSVFYRPAGGFPIANEIATTTETGTDCCIACQKNANCAGSFFSPSRKECRIRLTIRASFNATSPLLPGGNSTNGTAIFPTGTLALPAGTATGLTIQTQIPSTCPAGSDTLFLGKIMGLAPSGFPNARSLAFSNGRCGRYGVMLL